MFDLRTSSCLSGVNKKAALPPTNEQLGSFHVASGALSSPGCEGLSGFAPGRRQQNGPAPRRAERALGRAPPAHRRSMQPVGSKLMEWAPSKVYHQPTNEASFPSLLFKVGAVGLPCKSSARKWKGGCPESESQDADADLNAKDAHQVTPLQLGQRGGC